MTTVICRWCGHRQIKWNWGYVTCEKCGKYKCEEMTNQDKIDLVTKLLQNGLDRISDDMDDMLFNPEARPIGRWEETHPSHTMVGVGEPGTMGWEGYACKKCWAREGTEEAHGECRHKV